MEFTNEAFLTQLEYHPSAVLLGQLGKIKDNTKNFDYMLKHILNLHEQLKPYGSFVALSNSNDFIKIKNQADEALKTEVAKIIEDWAQKYKIDIEKVFGKETYYIKGYEK